MSSSSSSFAVQVGDPADGNVTVVVRGELDMSAAPELSAALAEAGGHPDVDVTLDLNGVTFLDSSAIGALIAAGHALTEAGHQLRIGPRSAIVARVLEITGLDETSAAFVVLPEQG